MFTKQTKLTSTEVKVLKQAVDDGGSVELAGIDQHVGWGKRERTAAKKLEEKKLGRTDRIFDNQEPKWFEINEQGRKALNGQ